MSEPRFSIVIPTRNRPETLHFTLKTCLSQNFESYEVIVADNGDGSWTQSVVNDFQNDHIKYVRAPHPLAMSNNFELGVSEARGEYIILIGDDDALLPNALASLDLTIRQTHSKAICWDLIFYNWPSMTNSHLQNFFHVPLPNGRDDMTLDGKTIMNHVINLEMSYAFLPMLYHSAIHRDLIQELKAKTGRVFHSRIPDIYSGFAIAYLVGSYHFKAMPCSISGISGKSNGIAHLFSDPQNGIVADFQALNDQEQLYPHPKVAPLNSVTSGIAEAFEFARDQLFPDKTQNPDLDYDRQSMILYAIVTTQEYYETDRNNIVLAIQTSLADDPSLLEWFNTYVINQIDTIRQEIPPPETKPVMSEQVVGFNAAQRFGAYDIFQVAKICQHVLNQHTLDHHVEQRAAASTPFNPLPSQKTQAQ